MGRAIHGDLPFGHGLKQRGLGLGRCAVDLVGDHHVGEQRPRSELERPGRAVPHAHTHDVAGQQVGGELDAPEGPVDRAGEGLGKGGLAHSGDVLDEEMALREQADQSEVDDVVLAVDHQGDVVGKRQVPVREAAPRRLGLDCGHTVLLAVAARATGTWR